MELRGQMIKVVVVALCSFTTAMASGQEYPSKPVRIVVAWAPGGAVDTVTRIIGQKLNELWKQPIIVDNRGGAGGNIGAAAVAKAVADGYTLLTTSNAIVISPAVYKEMPYDTAKDIAPVIQLTSSYFVLTAHPSLGVRHLKELIEKAKSQPSAINYGSVGIGSGQHLVMERLKGRAGIDLLHVPYKGDASITPALLSGEAKVALMTPNSVAGHVKAGKLLAIAVTKGTRTPKFEGVPTMAETLPGFEDTGYQGLYAPAATPSTVVAKIRRDVARVLAMPDVQQKLAAGGFEPSNTTPDTFPARFHKDIATFVQIVKDARIPLQ